MNKLGRRGNNTGLSGEAQRGSSRRSADTRMGNNPRLNKVPDLLDDLANRLHCPILTGQQLDALTPAFELVPYRDAQARNCIALINVDGSLLLVASDPTSEGFFDPVAV